MKASTTYKFPHLINFDEPPAKIKTTLLNYSV